MIDKRFFESFLRLNNVRANAPAGEITTLLTQAHWPKDEIEEALLVHNSGGVTAHALAQDPHGKMFRPDMDWPSSKLSSLLGIDVVIDPKSFHIAALKKEQVRDTGKKILIGLSIIVVAIAIAASIGFGLMYLFKVGPFYTHVGNII